MDGGIDLKMMKLKREEEEELAAMKEKRLKLEDEVKKENEKKAREKLVSMLRKEKDALEENLEKAKQKSFALKIENDSWESVRRKNAEDLKIAEKMLNDRHEKIWKNREFFCDETEKYVEEYAPTSKWWKEQMKIINDPQVFKLHLRKKNQAKMEKENREKIIYDLEKEIVELKNEIEKEEKEKRNNDSLMKQLEMEKESLLQEVNGGEFLRIKENLEAVNKRCAELAKRIKEKETQNPTRSDFEADDLMFEDFEMEPSEKTEEHIAVDFPSPEKPEPPAKSRKTEEITKPDSFLFQMLDPKTVKAAKANAKSRKLSSMTAQERNRQLQLSFNDFLSQLQE